MITIGSLVRQKRIKAGLKQGELAELVGIQQGYLNQIESDSKVGSIQTLLAIAKVLKIKPAYKIFAVLDIDETIENIDQLGQLGQLGSRFTYLPESFSENECNRVQEFIETLAESLKYKNMRREDDKKAMQAAIERRTRELEEKKTTRELGNDKATKKETSNK